MDVNIEITEYGKTFSKNLRDVIYESGKTQTEVAKDLGINKSTMSTWVNGTRVPRMDKIDRLCAYFGCMRSRLMEPHTDGAAADKSDAMQKLITTAAGCTPEQIRTAIILLETLKKA